jgi:hypothetical protein
MKNLKEQYASSNHLFLPCLPASRHAYTLFEGLGIQNWQSTKKECTTPLTHIFPCCHSKTCKLLYLKHYVHSKLVCNLNREKHAKFTHSRTGSITRNQPKLGTMHISVKCTQHDQPPYTKCPSPQSAFTYLFFIPQS